MHELSLAAEVIKLVESEAVKHNARSVDEITIEVGDFSGVQAEAFRSALEILSENSGIRDARINIERKKGKGICPACSQEFEMEQRIDRCPACGEFPSEIISGYEFRVVSLTIEND